MKKFFLSIILLMLCHQLCMAQDPAYPTPSTLTNIIGAEYFFDNLVQPGNGTPIPISPSFDIALNNYPINISTLSSGYHQLYIRTLSADGKWSITNSKRFYIDQDPLYSTATPLTNIVKAEYFIDNFVAFGNGTPIPLSPSNDLSNINLSINTNSLQGGYHFLYIRTKDTNGKWSMTNIKRFYVDQDPPYSSTPSNVLMSQAEFFIDNFVPIGSGTPITLPTLTDIDSLSISIPTQNLCHGLHKLYIRTKDENGKWSMTNIKEFNIEGDEQIVQYQYFFDTDPGHGVIGNGMMQPISPSTTFSQNINVNIPSNLNEGFHTLFTRVKNDHCVWSLAERSSFLIKPITITTPIVKYQYYFDEDPGLGISGNGAIQNVSVDSTISLTLNINIPSYLTEGFHTLFTRVQNSAGVWSITERSAFYIYQNQSSQFITALEYYFDNDPGIGNATPYSITSDSTLNISATIPTTGLSAGLHYLYVRAKDENNRWSIIERDTLNIVDTSGTPATCLRFDGINDYVNLLSSNLNTPYFSYNSTIEMWVKWNGTNQDQGYAQMYGAVLGKQLNGSYSAFMLGLNGPDPNTAKIIWRGSNGNITDITSNISPGNGWNHIAITLSPTSQKMYVNGILQGSANSGLYINVSTTPITLGAWIGDGDSYANADIDEVRIWGVERSQADIIDNMNCEYHEWSSGPLIALYHCNQGIAEGDNFSIPINTLENEILFGWFLNTSTLQNFALNGSSSNWVAPSPITTGGSCNYVNLQVFIEGYYNSNQHMTPVLYNQGINTSQQETDSIVVELRDSNTLSLAASTKTILNSNGMAYCKLPPLDGNYYIVVKHRNAIETWSAIPIPINSNISAITNYYFTVAATQAYGSNQIEVEPGIFAFYSGDINQDENIDLLDASFLEVDINNFEFGYFTTDINGDGNVDLLDAPFVENNINGFVFSSHP